MNYLRLKIWIILTFAFVVVAIVIRSVWQIVIIPTAGTMRIFIPLICALLGTEALVIYIAIGPSLKKLKSLSFAIGITVLATLGLTAGVTHYVHFIPSPEAELLLSKIIASFVLLSSLSAYSLLLWFIWSVWRVRER